MQIRILSSKAIVMMHDTLNGQMRHEIIFPTHILSKYEKKLRIPVHSKEL